MTPTTIADSLDKALLDGNYLLSWRYIWAMLDDILDSIKLAEESGDGNILATLESYIANHYS